MKKIIFVFMLLSCLLLSGCGTGRNGDYVEIYNKSSLIFDDITIDVKDGYFYDSCEKFTVDENTIGLTIYFSNLEDRNWE